LVAGLDPHVILLVLLSKMCTAIHGSPLPIESSALHRSQADPQRIEPWFALVAASRFAWAILSARPKPDWSAARSGRVLTKFWMPLDWTSREPD